MTHRHGGKLSHGEIRDAASREGLDPDRPIETIREELHISTCKWCGAEFVNGWSEGFCTDQCEVDYIKEYHR